MSAAPLTGSRNAAEPVPNSIRPASSRLNRFFTRASLAWSAKRPLPQQVPRLALVFAVAVLGLIVARQVLIPATFGDVDHYRAAAVDSWRERSRTLGIKSARTAFLLHGYVGFIFGSVKANPWWSSVLMPVVFLFSAIVSGIALVLLLYMIITSLRWKPLDMACLDKLAAFLFYAMVVDVALEMLDFLHRLYESEESIETLSQMIESRLFISLIVLQVPPGTIVPLVVLGAVSPALRSGGFVRTPDELRRLLYLGSAALVQVGIFSIRWNVVIGGQLFSKSLRGLTVYRVDLFGLEGLAITVALLRLPFAILWALIKVLPPWQEATAAYPVEKIA